jgi:AmiR/NasT family two-component response regulator
MEIRERIKVMTPKVILLTSYHDAELSNRYKPAGFAAYLTTPVTQSDVFDCLASVFMQTVQ